MAFILELGLYMMRISHYSSKNMAQKKWFKCKPDQHRFFLFFLVEVTGERKDHGRDFFGG